MSIKAVQQQEEPLFRTEAGALRFALNYQHGGMKRSCLASLIPGGSKGRGLGGLDGAAQAGMIRAQIDRLGTIRGAIIVARFAEPTIPCACGRPCCRQWLDNPDWIEAVRKISEWLLYQGAAGTVSHYHLREAIVKRFFGVRISLAEVADRCRVKRDMASEYNRKSTDLLKKEQQFARYEIEGFLKADGIVA